jgi:hypothetical protein
MRELLFVAALSFTAVGCGDDEACNPQANTGCDDGLVCEEVVDGEPACFAPMLVRGDVFDLDSSNAIDGARVVALDVNGSPQSSVAVTEAGEYELRIPATRNADGTPVAQDVTLRADAATYQSFPSGIRQALPIDTGAAVKEGNNYVVDSALTQIGLLRLANAGTASLSGNVEVGSDPRGVLVVAETSSAPGSGYSAIADTTGSYQIFNMPAGDFTVRAYAIGVNYTPVNVSLAAGQAGSADLDLDEANASLVSGTVTLVEGAPVTSVIMVVASTFDTRLARGETPPGLRAPSPGVVPDIAGAWSIEGVPAGRYVVLAAFENDGAVRDQSDIGGTELVFVDVAGDQDLPIGPSFKVTEAITLVGPGANGPESMTAKPTLSWMKDPSAKDYHVQVFDALGAIVMDEHTNDGGTISMPYTGPFDPGMYYQVRITSYDDASPPSALANTEDLRGVFFHP